MTKHEYICKITEVVASKSDCRKRQVGAVFVNKDYEILATGYNAPEKGAAHCDRYFSDLIENKKCTCSDPLGVQSISVGPWSCKRNIHAEQNALVQAAKRGTALENSFLYCTYMPCIECSKLLVNVGVIGVYVKENNKDGGFHVLLKGGISIQGWD